MGRKLTEEEFNSDRQSFEKLLMLRILINYSEFSGTSKRYLFECLLCGEKRPKNYTDVKNGSLCGSSACVSKVMKERQKISKEKFEEEKILFRSRNNIELLITYDQYVNTTTKYPCKCTICGKNLNIEYSLLRLRGTGCKQCRLKDAGLRRRVSQESFEKVIAEFSARENIVVLSGFDNMDGNQTKLLCECLRCGKKFYKIFANMSTSGCSCKVIPFPENKNLIKIGIKYCSICKEKKPISEFYKYKNGGGDHGFSYFCKRCGKKKRQTGEWRYSALKNNAKKRGIPFTLSKNEYLSLFNRKECYYCKTNFDTLDSMISWVSEYRGNNRTILSFLQNNGKLLKTMDRMNNELGYEKNNVICCCGLCNSKKGADLTTEEMVELAPKIMRRYFDSFMKEGYVYDN